MVLGLRSKHRKDASIQVNYHVHVQEIKPWPPSQSLKSTQSLLLHWENGDRISGSLTSVVGDDKIEFGKSFSLSLTLCQEKRARDKFQKNYLEFHLYEPRKDKAGKGQLLGTAIINLADYGVIDNSLTISAPLNCKKISKIVAEPVVFLKIQSIDKNGLSKEVSLEKDGQDSVSELTNEGNDEELEIASFTDDDDDVSSHSSRTVASSAFDATAHSPSQNEKDATLPVEVEPAKSAVDTQIGVSSEPSETLYTMFSVNLSPNLQNPVNNHNNFSKLPERNIGHEQIDSNGKNEEVAQQFVKNDVADKVTGNIVNSHVYSQVGGNSEIASSRDTEFIGKDDEQAPRQGQNGQLKAITFNGVNVGPGEGKEERTQQQIAQEAQILEEKRQFSEDNLVGKFLASRKQDKLRSNTLASSRKVAGIQDSTVTNGKLKHLKSVQLSKASEFFGNDRIAGNANELDKPADHEATESKGLNGGSLHDKNECKSRIEVLEEELRETAAIEVGLYSIIAEHGGSINKVHAPARRLSRFYLHSCTDGSQEKRANAARAAISGLVLVSKACGNDVPRLTFWLSNSVMLRAIIDQAVREMSVGRFLRKRDESSPTGEGKNNCMEEFDDWQDPQTFVIALEKVEAWIFSRIIESVWWQTMTPHMQSTAAKASGRSMGSSGRKTSGSKHALSSHERGDFPAELWKKAFKDACERLCPIRAGGHECGCLPVLARLVMEQLVARLDVAMFNAILRESADEMPTDPLSDPIADLRVLPVPAGRSSFGAGAQLKNAIGNWSRWLTDLFGIEDNDSPEDSDNLDKDSKPESDSSFKPFRLLNALSDLMMLPFEMLADVSTRKEVCPTFSALLIKRVASSFVPDEFCPNPIPNAVLEALDSEDATEASEESVTSYPCFASPTAYSPPPAASLSGIIGDLGSHVLQRSGSSLLKKSYTSDDELDELDSPLTSIITDNFRGSPTSKRPNWMPKGGRSIVRYQLLREVWRDGE